MRNVAKSVVMMLVVLAVVCWSLPAEAQVMYRLDGMIAQTPDGPFFYAEDGRIFHLLFKAESDNFGLGFTEDPVKKFAGKLVHLEGMSLSHGNHIDRLEVKHIRLVETAQKPVADAPIVARMRAPKIVEWSANKIRMGNVRSGFSLNAAKEQVFQWETTTIRPDMIDRVFFFMKPFPPKFVAGHAFLLFTFKKGGMVDSKGKTSQGLVLTIEALLREGQQYSLKQGFRNAMPIIWILASWEDYSTLQCGTPGKSDSQMIPYPIKLDQTHRINLLREALQGAGANREGERYDLLRNNCTNNLVLLLNRVVPAAQRVNPWTLPRVFYNPQATVPVFVPKALTKAGILGPAATTINENNFFEQFDKLVPR